MSNRLFKLVSLLVQYPDESLISGLGEIELEAKKLASSQGKPLTQFVDYLKGSSLTELQKKYVETYDFNKRTSLYLSFHNYGDRRQRGMAMLQLKRRYASAGLPLVEGQLPDYLPAVLEFAAYAPDNYGLEVLGEFRPSLELVRAALDEDKSPYAALLDVVVKALPRLSLTEIEAIKRLAAEGPPVEAAGQEPFAPPEVMPMEPEICGVRA